MKLTILKNRTDRVGREYPVDELQKFLGRDFYGELGGPVAQGIDLSTVSHQIKNLRLEGDDLVGDLHVLDTPMGNVLKDLLENNVQIKTGFRAIGMVGEDKKVSSLEVIAVDLNKVDQ